LRGGKKLRTKKRKQAKVFSIAATVLMTFSLFTPAAALAESSNKIHQSVHESGQIAEVKVSDRLLKQFKDDEKVTFLVKFKEKADVEKVAADAKASASKANLSSLKAEHIQRSAVVSELKATALQSQQDVLDYLNKEVENGNAEDLRSYHIVNGIAVTATKDVAEKIAAFAEVEKNPS